MFLGALILYWTYRDFDVSKLDDIFDGGINWWWMMASMPFGILAQLFRGWRWKLSLVPLGETPKVGHCVNAVFVSYAANLLVPRVGEISRCGILKNFDGVSFTKSLGTVVTERVIDSLCVLLITGVTLLTQMGVFSVFFKETGTDLRQMAGQFTSVHYIILGISTIAILALLLYIVKKISFFTKVKSKFNNLCEGIFSLRVVTEKWLFLFYTIGIWASYILHFSLTLYAFDFTAHLGFVASLVMFAVGSIAVVVPTPNGAGPWHFAVITMLGLYGVGLEDAGIFALLVHSIQTLLIVLLGIWGMLALSLEKKEINK